VSREQSRRLLFESRQCPPGRVEAGPHRLDALLQRGQRLHGRDDPLENRGEALRGLPGTAAVQSGARGFERGLQTGRIRNLQTAEPTGTGFPEVCRPPLQESELLRSLLQ